MRADDDDAALAYVAFQVDDTFVFTAALITAGSVLGFFVWNFPAGLIPLGDGGAYLLGFLLAELSILLVHRNPIVSPIFALLLCTATRKLAAALHFAPCA